MMVNIDWKCIGKKQFKFLFLVNIIIFLRILFAHTIVVKAETNDNIQTLLNENTGLLKNKQSSSIVPLTLTKVTSGNFGTCAWDIDDNGQLTIHAGTLADGKGNWSPFASSIKSVYVEEGVSASSSSLNENGNNGVFSDLPNVTLIDVSNLDVSNSFYLGYMFSEDTKLQKIVGLENWDTSNCIWMASMFYKDSALQSLDLSNFDTYKVQSIGSMFADCTSLEELNLLNWNTDSLLYMQYIFRGVPGKINGLKNLNTSKVTDLTGVFKNTDFTVNDPSDIAGWDVSNVSDMTSLFENTKFEELDLSKWKTDSLVDLTSAFSMDSNIDKIKGLSNFDTSNVTSLSHTFDGVTDANISSIKNWDVFEVNSLSGTFANCTNLESLDLSNWDTKNGTVTIDMFLNDKLLNEDTLQGYKTLVNNKNYNVSGMFQGTGFKILDLTQYDTSNVTNFSRLFKGTKKLEKILGTFDTSSAIDLSDMFNGSNIVDFDGLNIADWNTSSVTNLSQTFTATKIMNFDFLKNWNTSSVTNLSGIFQNTMAEDIPAIKNWDVSQVTSFQNTFQKNYFKTLPIENWDVSNATNMLGMFFYSYSLKNLDLSKWNTSKVTNFYTIFNTMSNLETLDISGFDMTNATNLNYFFGGNGKLWKVTLGPKVLMKTRESDTNVGTQLPSPVPGTKIGDTTNTAISTKWQEVDEDAGGTDYEPAGELLSNNEIMQKYATTGNPVTTYVWQQQPKIDFSMTIPDIDFGTVNNGSQIVQRKNKSFAIEMENNNYPAEAIKSNLTVSLAKPLTSSNGLNTMNNVLIYREKGKNDQILSSDSVQIYEGTIPTGNSSIEWDEKNGLLLNMKNEPHAVNGNYSATLNWTMTNSL